MASTKKFQPCSQTDKAPDLCPLCEGPNDCKLCSTSGSSEPCWCATVKISAELLACVPKSERNRCLCSNCVLTHFAPRVTSAARKLAILLLLLQPAWLWAGTFTENFSQNPTTTGWHIFGTNNLFTWDSTNQQLRVTWDSSKPNNYFHHPLSTILASSDDFSLSFDLMFEDYITGISSNKPGTFEAAVGFFNLDQAVKTNLLRGSGINSTYGARNLIEFNFFPAFDTFNPTIASTVVATNYAHWFYNHDNQLDMTPGEMFHVLMDYSATTRTLTTTVTRTNDPYGPTQTITIPSGDDFRLTTFSISSYNDAGQNPLYAGSIRAHGIVDNIALTVPAPPVENLVGGFIGANWQVQFTSRTNWSYTLERATCSNSWTNSSPSTLGNGALVTLSDTNPPTGQALYRVRANRL